MNKDLGSSLTFRQNSNSIAQFSRIKDLHVDSTLYFGSVLMHCKFIKEKDVTKEKEVPAKGSKARRRKFFLS